MSGRLAACEREPVSYSDPLGLMADTIPQAVQDKLGNMCEKMDCNKAQVITAGPVQAVVMKASKGRPVTLGNDIYISTPPNPTDVESMATMAHELTHVGQYQHQGTIGYYIQAIDDRIFEWRGGDPYAWRGQAGTLYDQFRRMEQRAQIVEDCFRGNARACGLSPYTFHPGG